MANTYLDITETRNFASRPEPPYIEGDTWTQGGEGDILRCTHPRTSSEEFDADDWVAASKYTDDTLAQEGLDMAQATRMVIRETDQGIEVGYADGAIKALINAAGSFDIVKADGESDKVLARYGEDEVKIGAWGADTQVGDTATISLFEGSGSITLTIGATRDALKISAGDLILSGQHVQVNAITGAATSNDLDVGGTLTVGERDVADWMRSAENINGWTVMRIGKYAICTRHEVDALFTGGNGYVRMWETSLPLTFASPPDVLMTKRDTVHSAINIAAVPNVESATTTRVGLSYGHYAGSLPDPFKVPFHLAVFGTVN